MPAYTGLTQMVGRTTVDSAPVIFGEQVVPYLVELWRSGYERAAGESQLVQRTVSSVSYLFDVGRNRLVASWTLSPGGVVGGRRTPPALQFTYWDYEAPEPVPAVEQGVVVAGRPPVITTYPERTVRAAC